MCFCKINFKRPRGRKNLCIGWNLLARQHLWRVPVELAEMFPRLSWLSDVMFVVFSWCVVLYGVVGVWCLPNTPIRASLGKNGSRSTMSLKNSGRWKPVHCFKPKTCMQLKEAPDAEGRSASFSVVAQRCRFWDAHKSTCVFDLCISNPSLSFFFLFLYLFVFIFLFLGFCPFLGLFLFLFPFSFFCVYPCSCSCSLFLFALSLYIYIYFSFPFPYLPTNLTVWRSIEPAIDLSPT